MIADDADELLSPRTYDKVYVQHIYTSKQRRVLLLFP